MNTENSRYALVRAAEGQADENASETLLEQLPSDKDKKEDEAKKKEEEAKKKEEEKPKLIGPLELFKYADNWEKLMMFVGMISAVMNGGAAPFMMVIFSESIDYFVDIGKVGLFVPTITDFLASQNLTQMDVIRHPEMMNDHFCSDVSAFYGGSKNCTVRVNQSIFETMSEMAGIFCILAIVVLVFGYLQVMLWMISSERQAFRIRRSCLHNILCQNIGWFDTHNAAEFNNRLTDDISKIQDGIGDKFVMSFQWLATCIVAFVIAFSYGWKMSLVILAIFPVFTIITGGVGKLAAAMTSKELEEYAKAGGIAQEVFGAIRTVVAFGGQDKESLRYRKNLDRARGYGIKKAITQGLSLGAFWGIMLFAQSFTFWYGGKLHRDEPENYSAAEVLTVFMCIMMGGFGLGNALSGIQSLAVARGAAYNVYNIIELVSPINGVSEEGKKPASLTGTIGFRNVHFSYPSRPGVKVLDGVSIEVHPGQTVALVGSSGCGKSTTVQLLLRFYDAIEGQVTIDGVDVKELNVKWLRQHIGLVSQEPVLFATTIAENIRYGREDVTMDEIIISTKNANAYDFIMQLPDKFETFVGERGAQLSGGQKQRIAIARALVRDPKILLLDEATSALDTESESIVQDALDKACKGRTTLIIAHRLSTIKNADIIIGYQNGQVKEKGTHDELMDQQGIYYTLVTNQMTSSEEVYAGPRSPRKENDEKIVLLDDVDLEVVASSIDSKKPPIEAVEEPKGDDDLADVPDAPFTRVFKMNLPEWYFMALGCFGSIVSGCVLPIFGYFFGSVMFIFAEDVETQKEQFLEYAIKFIVLAIITLFAYVLQSSMFGFSGETLTVRLRDYCFRALVKQDITYFDDPKNGVGALTTRLATDASLVQGVTGVRLGSMLMSLTDVIVTLIIAFMFGWKMTLVLIGFLPFLAVGDFIRVKMIAGQLGKSREALEGAGKVTVESVGNIRTVASLSKEETFFSLYIEKLEEPYRAAKKNAHFVAIAFSFSQCALYFFYACSFVFGAFMIEEGDMTSQDVFRVFNAVVIGAVGIGNASAFAPDLGKAKASAKRIFQILDSEPTIDHTNAGGEKLEKGYSATVAFKDVHFHYPLREAVPVLKGMNISVAPGQTLALVGSSGCGKTTTVSLLERFYDTVAGKVCLDDHDIKTLNIDWLRSQMALVAQEPVLFDQTIGENIAFGDNSRDVSMDEIIQAARTANIHSFITSLPDGYDTNVGAKGTQLSGGQKQRIAIARALVRNPKLLLLDEATSALDTESEKVVQEALERARTGRTCIIIAHRLSTVKNSDKICIISHGEVTEQGSHNELMALKGFYHKLVGKSGRAV